MADQYSTRLKYKAFEAFIEVDNDELKQYGVECNEAEQQASCWVASEADKEFSISFSINVSVLALAPEATYTARVFLDGIEVGGRLLSKSISRTSIDSTPISDYEEQKFMFGSLELTDDDAHLENASSATIGEIKVIFSRVTGTTRRSAAPLKPTLPLPGKLHERSKKGLAHRVKYGGTRQRKFQNNSIVQGEITMAKLIFRYRPLSMLQANGIAPRMSSSRETQISHPPSPVPSASKRKAADVKVEDNDEDDEEDEEDTSEEQALRARLEAIEKAKSARDKARRQRKKVKQEPISYFTPGEVIDLTI